MQSSNPPALIIPTTSPPTTPYSRLSIRSGFPTLRPSHHHLQILPIDGLSYPLTSLLAITVLSFDSNPVSTSSQPSIPRNRPMPVPSRYSVPVPASPTSSRANLNTPPSPQSDRINARITAVGYLPSTAKSTPLPMSGPSPTTPHLNHQILSIDGRNQTHSFHHPY
jgi:hypothetical protein